jgi:hypothetical protein
MLLGIDRRYITVHTRQIPSLSSTVTVRIYFVGLKEIDDAREGIDIFLAYIRDEVPF